jgi:hypothetical protein
MHRTQRRLLEVKNHSRKNERSHAPIMKTTKLITLTTLIALLLTGGGIGPAQAQQPSVSERVAALKATVAASQMVLRQYEWIETTVVR